MEALWDPLLTQACLACCKDQSQIPRAACPTRKGAQVPLGPCLLMWPLQMGSLSSGRPLWLHLSRAPSSWPAEDSQQPTPPLTWGLSWEHFWAEPLMPGCSEGQGLPLPRLSDQNLCWVLVSRWGFSLPFRGKSLSLHVSHELPEDTVLWEEGQRSRARCRGPWRHVHAGPGVLPQLAPARLFCALVTYESPPGPQSIPVIPWGLPAKLLALRGSCSAGPSALGQALGVARTSVPSPRPPPHPYTWSLPGPEPPCRWASIGHCLRKSLEGHCLSVQAEHPVPRQHLGLGCSSLGKGQGLGEGPCPAASELPCGIFPSGHSWNELCRGSGGGTVPSAFPGT